MIVDGPELHCATCGGPVRPSARFCETCGASLGTTEVGAPGARTRAVPRSDELRPVTALFADIVGSTSLSERLRPDEVKALIGECVSRMSRAVEEFGGVIQAIQGDGICAYFGVPVAHEDDPERAARAALRVLQVVGEYRRDVEAAWGIPDFNVRVGINSGQTGVGLVGGADPQAVALGDATNVAARLESATDPGTILIGEATAKRLGHGFTFQSLGEVWVKGKAEPVRAYRLMGLRTGEGDAEAVPLVGRDSEMAQLGTVLDELEAGRGQILLLVGETGVGKTRLLSELRTVARDRATWLECRCVSYGGEVMSWPFVEMLLGWLGAQDVEAPVAIRMKLRAKLGTLLGSSLGQVLPYLARLLSLDVEPEFGAELKGLTQEQLGERIRGAYVAWIEALADHRPVAIAVDDLHWASASTRALAEDLLAVTDRAPVLLAAALRPDPASEGWRLRLRVMAEFPHRAVELPLGPLSEEAALELADAVLPQGSLDEATQRGIVMRAEGNPLYLEELLRSIAESGGLSRRGSWTLTVSTAQLLPPSLESLFVARIDRLPEGARQLAQVAAVVGRTFPVRVLERVMEARDVRPDLSMLLRSGLVREVRRYPELECTFRHGLFQEAALSTLPKTRLRELYGRVGEAFEHLFSSSIDDHLEALAYYFYRSDDEAKALNYLERAGDKAARLNDSGQAFELWRRAAKLASKLGETGRERRIEERLAAAEAG